MQSLGGNVYHVCRGSVLELEGKSYLCFGGAESQDKDDREPGVNWWKQEMPSDEEYDTCRRNLEAVDYKVDYVLTQIFGFYRPCPWRKQPSAPVSG